VSDRVSDRVSDHASNRPDGFGPLSPDEWRVFGPLVNAALDTPPERRARFIADACHGDTAMTAQLRQLIEECEQSDAVLDAGAIERFSFLLDDDETVSRFPATLAGRYHVDREIGRGGMAIVFLAHDAAHDRPVAVKVLRPSARARVGADRFLAEIRTTAALRHPHIVPLYDSGEAEESLYYVMPYYDGGTLASRLDEKTQLPVDEALRIASDVAAALEHAHGAGFIHRDIKPSNILFSSGQALLADFGVARPVERTQRGLTSTGVIVGTPEYMSPEQAAGARTLDARSDIYSLGCVLFEMIAGEAPAAAVSTETLSRQAARALLRLRAARHDLPPSVERCVSRALSPDASARYAGATEMSHALAACARAIARPESAARRGLDFIRKSMTGIMLAAAARGRGGGRGRAPQ
jgi:serine/threonine-protein kinase